VTTKHDPEIAGDIVLAIQALAASFGEAVLARVRAEAGEQLRYNDGYVIQHLVHEPVTITRLAQLLGVSQQAASKQVADLQARGVVRTTADDADRRAKLVELTDVGRAAIEAGRRARRQATATVAEVLGANGAKRFLRDLDRLAEHEGAWDLLLQRRLRPESDR
jgi:DNA-binding MarR family transcriptional regulator